jgi:hypothetical protein
MNYLDEDLANGMYQYHVTAIYDSGESEPTNTVEVTIEVLYVPTNLTYEVQNGNDVALSWDAPAMRALLGYRIYKDDTLITETTEMNYLDEDLENGIYQYHVTAIYDSGESEPTNTVEVSIEVLYAPTNLTYEVQNENDVALSWEAPAMRALLGYKIYKDDTLITETTETNYLDENLANGMYQYQVTAIYDSGESEPTNTVEVIIEVLYEPTNLTYEVQNGNDVALTWDAPAMRALLGYKIYKDDTLITETTEMNYLDEDLENGIYQYHVTAIYDSGESEPTNTVEVSIEVLYAPTNLTYEIQNENDVALSWDAPAMRALLGYRIYKDALLITETTETTYLDEDLANGMYQYQVTAIYDSGESEPTNTVEVIIEVLYAPINLTYEVQNGNDVALIWDAPAMRALLGYRIYKDDVLISETTETNYLDENLANGMFEYHVTAIYDSGESEPTNSVEVEIDVQTNDEDIIDIASTKMNSLYPNPFNPSTNISYSLATDEFVSIIIYDIKGKKIKTLVSENQTSGNYLVHWNGLTDNHSKAASGMYLVRMTAGRYSTTQKAVLLK